MNVPEPLIALLGAALVFLVVYLLFRPERGLFARWQRTARITQRVRREDALKHIHNCEMNGDRPTLQSLAGVLSLPLDKVAKLVEEMQTRELLHVVEGSIKLTPSGRQAALHILRSHRLWEHYLAERTGFPETEWHDQAEFYEHRLTPAETEALSAKLGHPTYDPHGDPIPTPEGEYVSPGGLSLPSAEVDIPLRIVHMEDEPEAVYAQLVAEGLHPGMQVRLIELDAQRVRFWAGEEEHVLAPIVAANITVLPLEEEAPSELGRPLTDMHPGQTGTVLALSPACRGLERRRLLDLGVLPGTRIHVEYRSPSGDPTAYRVRDAVIALRREQAAWIRISLEESLV